MKIFQTRKSEETKKTNPKTIQQDNQLENKVKTVD